MARETKGKILEAAARVAVARGVQNLTMDAVAAEAGVSKGGVFYHFASKENLLLGMVNALVEITEERIRVSQVADKERGSWVRGFIEACLTKDDESVGSVGRLSVAFLTAAANDTNLLKPMVERQAEWRQNLNTSGIDPVLAHIIRLAADGLWINDVMGVPVLDETERSKVVGRLMEMTRPQETNSTEQRSPPA